MRIQSAVGLSLAAILLPAALAQSSTTPPLLAAALSPIVDDTTYAYEFTMTEAGSREMKVRGRIDPSKPKGQRVELIDGSGKDLDLAAMDERMEENADGDIWCDSMISGAAGKVTETTATDGSRKYSFRPTARPDAESEEAKMFEKLIANAVIDETSKTLKSFTASLQKPWKPNIMAKIHEFSMSGDCALAPNGRAYARTITTRIRGSALGQDFTSNNTRRITRITPAG